MIIICLSCKLGIRVMDDPKAVQYLLGKDSDFWPDKYECFSCGARAHIYVEQELSPEVITSTKFHNLTAEEAFAALSGLGVPEERNCCAEVLETLFEKQGIRVRGRQHHGQMKYYIDYLEFKDGTRMYLAPSPMGACVYRIAKPHSYTEGVLNAD